MLDPARARGCARAPRPPVLPPRDAHLKLCSIVTYYGFAYEHYVKALLTHSSTVLAHHIYASSLKHELRVGHRFTDTGALVLIQQENQVFNYIYISAIKINLEEITRPFMFINIIIKI